MTTDRLILIIIGACSLLAAATLVHRGKRRIFALGFLVCEALTWVAVMFHIKFHVLSFPVREFPKATNMGFTIQYLFYPVVCGLYLIHEPRGTLKRRLLYLLPWSAGLALFHWVLRNYTHLIQYHQNPSVLILFLIAAMFALLFALVNGIVRWFFKDFALEAEGGLR